MLESLRIDESGRISICPKELVVKSDRIVGPK